MGGSEEAYRDDVEWLSRWWRENNVVLNKTKEMIIDYKKNKKRYATTLHQRGLW